MIRGAAGRLTVQATASKQQSLATALQCYCRRWTIGGTITTLPNATVRRSLTTAIPSIRNHRSQHSSEWIRRHITDPYVQRAQECDYRSRSAFKLKQLDDEYLFLRKDRVVLDLGCYPGGWCQVAAKRCLVPGHEPTDQPNGGASTPSTSRVIGVDVAQMDPLSNVQFIRGRVGDAKTLHAVLQALGDRKADVVLSDMAPACTGIRHDDHYNSVELCLYAADLMEQVSAVALRGQSKLGNFTSIHSVQLVPVCLPQYCRFCALVGLSSLRYSWGAKPATTKRILRAGSVALRPLSHGLVAKSRGKCISSARDLKDETKCLQRYKSKGPSLLERDTHKVRVSRGEFQTSSHLKVVPADMHI